MVEHPVGYVLLFSIAFYILGIDREIDRAIVSKNGDKLWTMSVNFLKKITIDTKIYIAILFLSTIIALAVCYVNTREIRSIVCRKYVLTMLVILVIKKFVGYIKHKK